MNKLNEFETQWVTKINEYLTSQLKQQIQQPLLNEAMTYSVAAGGKRLRPLLTLATLTTFNVSITEDRLKAATALELVHTYSLIHDDLPAMDNDDLRRGKPTNHVKFGEDIAILAGDALLTLAFEWLTTNQLSTQQQVQLVAGIAQAAGPNGMVAGQVDDVANEANQLTLDQLMQLHKRKTGDLIHYAVLSGLIMADATDYTNWLQFADSFGLAFQIYDDILDVTSNEADLGKPVAQDGNKNTYPNLLGLDGAYQKLATTIEEGRQALQLAEEQTGLNTTLLESFFSYFKLNEEN
ncbi:polyprenyl synthetase family protein [Lentilactobacillus senioris]|uniref:polyprenyl synthetase family protein n=1 Tax=Lentilactobacillus senioris TaxID=931534 RepID=UPI00227F87D0|nr:farnesyl diphosphate synthase [Lentilactobacillus senioris]MCY9806907.1 polyprenyl synthetase family protein [Lentilactobacillus senioris]